MVIPTNAKGLDEEDLLLVGRVVEGDRRAFESLVRRHERRVFRVTLAVLGNAEDAEEAMQDSFMKAFRYIGQFRKESRFTTWLTRIAVNEALQKRRTRKILVPLEEAGKPQNETMPHRFDRWRDDPEKLYGKQEMRQIVESAIQSLPEIYRETLVLRDIEGFSAEEAAEALGVKVPALKSRLLRARLMMRETLAVSFEEPPTLRTKIGNTAADIRSAVAMRLMRAVGR